MNTHRFASEHKIVDVIGDVHGQTHKLHGLLRQLGYHEHHGVYRHSERRAILWAIGSTVARIKRVS